MSILVKGTEDLGQITPNGSNKTLTIPAGTTGIVFAIGSSNDDVSGQVGTVTLGNLAVTLSQETDLGASTGSAVYHILDISGRDDDVLRLSGTYGGSSTWAAVYVSANLLAYDSADGWYAGCATCSGGPSVLSHSVTRPAGSAGLDDFLAVQALGAYTAAWTVLNSATELFRTTVGGDEQIGTYKMLSGTETMGFSGGGFWTAANGAVFYEAVEDLDFTPDSFGTELGFIASANITISSDMMLLPETSFGTEFGFIPGVAITKTHARQVALVGEGIDLVEMTEDGTEGQVLTSHAKRKPTWEDTVPTETDRLLTGDGISDPPEHVWWEDGLDFIYEGDMD